MEEFKEIMSWKHDPTKSAFKCSKSERGYFRMVYCGRTENCEAYKKGACIEANTFGSCPFSKAQKIYSPSQRAMSYDSFFAQNEELHKDSLKVRLKDVCSICGIGGDCVYLPIPYLGLMTTCRELEHIKPVQGGGYFDSGLVLGKEDFTPTNIIAMLRMQPLTFFDRVKIKDYHEKSVPLLVRQLKEYDKGLYDSVVALMTDEEKARLTNLSNVGRKALLCTLAPGMFKDCHGSTWQWDGEWLTSTDSHANFMLVDKFDEIRVRPRKDQVVKITDDSQVKEDTEFVD